MDLIEIDVIILSDAKTEELRLMTADCILSLISSEDSTEIKFNIVVIESEQVLQPYQYALTNTVYPVSEFGYHRFMNVGIGQTSAEFVCMCNNDLLFHRFWASEILAVFKKYNAVYSASPICPVFHPQVGFTVGNGIYPGYESRAEVAGWCIFFKREILSIIGKLDENYKFWYADDDYGHTLRLFGLNHVLVSRSLVTHLDSKTLKTLSKDEQNNLTENELVYFRKKWNARLGRNWFYL